MRFLALITILPFSASAQEQTVPIFYYSHTGSEYYFIDSHPTISNEAINGVFSSSIKAYTIYSIPKSVNGTQASYSEWTYQLDCRSQTLKSLSTHYFDLGLKFFDFDWRLLAPFNAPSGSFEETIWNIGCNSFAPTGNLYKSISSARQYTLSLAYPTPVKPAARPPALETSRSVVAAQSSAPNSLDSINRQLRAALEQDASKRWKMNSLVSGSYDSATPVSDEGWPGYSVYKMTYRYTSVFMSGNGWVKGLFKNGLLYCVTYDDYPNECFAPGGALRISNAPARAPEPYCYETYNGARARMEKHCVGD